jgi:hypothetical protein
MLSLIPRQDVATNSRAVNQEHFKLLAWKLLIIRYRATDNRLSVPIRDTS